MKVDVKKVDAIKREMKFEVPRERVTKALDAVYLEISKHAKIKGFRPGKAPRQVIENSYAKMAQEEMIKKLVPEAYHQALGEHKIEPIDLPEISDVQMTDGALTFKATLDIRPDIKLGTYKGITVVRKSNDVTDEELNKTLEFFQKGQGDKKIEMDDTFAKGMGFATLDEFKTALKRQLETDKNRQNRMDLENQIIEALVKDAKLLVPQSLKTRQLNHRLTETVKRMKTQGAKDEDIKAKIDEIRTQLEEVVEKDVKVYLILEEIAKLEKIEATDPQQVPHKVMELLLKEAKWQEAK